MQSRPSHLSGARSGRLPLACPEAAGFGTAGGTCGKGVNLASANQETDQQKNKPSEDGECPQEKGRAADRKFAHIDRKLPLGIGLDGEWQRRRILGRKLRKGRRRWWRWRRCFEGKRR